VVATPDVAPLSQPAWSMAFATLMHPIVSRVPTPGISIPSATVARPVVLVDFVEISRVAPVHTGIAWVRAGAQMPTAMTLRPIRVSVVDPTFNYLDE
jgi:hypothetical protein